MADRVFCIDFGSAFTKVALRRDPGADTELLTSRVEGIGAEFCIPTVAALDRTAARLVPEFGTKAVNRTPGNGIEVYQNWKKWVFAVPEATSQSQAPPLELFLQAEETNHLASKFGVSGGQLTQLRQLVATARILTGGPGGRVVSPEAQQHTFAATLAPHFFRWLREVVLDACTRLKTTGLKFEDIPVRVTVPAFGHGKDPEGHPGSKLLTDALAKAGWRLHPDRPAVSEPYSNAVGILTKGSNVLQKSRVQLGAMFGKGPLITVLKDSAHHPAYRAVVIDVGAFTTDFAAVSLDTDGKTIDDPDVAFAVRQHSVPLGVTDLDTRVVEALPEAQGAWLRKAKSLDWEDFRRAAYGEGKGLRRAEIGVIGGPSDAAVRDSLAAFVAQLVAEVEKFCSALDPVQVQELILTGGGSAVPAVRDAVQQAAQVGGQNYAKIHALGIKKTVGSATAVSKLDEQFTRGGSALGGASLYFEKEYY
ncbi:MAG: hypothetical protein JWO38_3889 [Gemmataceae bacterium]|nr:hypothetical protein [Gemmataceae bacterium]